MSALTDQVARLVADRLDQGLPEKVTDPTACARVATILAASHRNRQVAA